MLHSIASDDRERVHYIIAFAFVIGSRKYPPLPLLARIVHVQFSVIILGRRGSSAGRKYVEA